MHELWFCLVVVMFTVYAVMDGFDFGAGVLHLFVAKRDEERREVLGAIGPFWAGNEVWLLAGGGALFLAFPRVLAAGFSGFYLAMFLVVWVLILRGLSIEFRSHVRGELWRAFWDLSFAVASFALPILLGAAVGNLLRGVPLDASGFFNLPLFTDFSARNPVGILDWYSVLPGVVGLAAAAGLGALSLAWRTQGGGQARSRALARPLWAVVAGLWAIATLATWIVNPALLAGFSGSFPAWLLALVFLAGLATVFLGLARERPLTAFLGSGAFILGLLGASAACAWPVMLKSTLDPALSLTARNAGAGIHALRAGLAWWVLGFPLAAGYVALLFRIHRGKIRVAPEDEGY